MRTFVVVLVAVLAIAGTANAKPATPKDWTEFFEAVGDMQATMAQAEAAMYAPGDWRWNECRFQSLQRGIWTDREERLTAECAARKAGISLSTLLRVGACESNWNRFAFNPNGHAGLFQIDVDSWGSWVRIYGPNAWARRLSTRWTNSRSQVVVTSRYARANGWDAWSCY